MWIGVFLNKWSESKLFEVGLFPLVSCIKEVLVLVCKFSFWWWWGRGEGNYVYLIHCFLWGNDYSVMQLCGFICEGCPPVLIWNDCPCWMQTLSVVCWILVRVDADGARLACDKLFYTLHRADWLCMCTLCELWQRGMAVIQIRLGGLWQSVILSGRLISGTYAAARYQFIAPQMIPIMTAMAASSVELHLKLHYNAAVSPQNTIH